MKNHLYILIFYKHININNTSLLVFIMSTWHKEGDMTHHRTNDQTPWLPWWQRRIVKPIQEGVLSYIGAPEFLSIQIDITNACNLDCAHCYHPNHSNEGALSFDEWVHVLSQYKALCEKLRRKPDIIICGGEPTFSPLFRPLIKHISQHFPEATIAVLSNGTLLRRETVQFLRQFNVEVQVSLDGANSESHDSVRGPAAFTRALRGIMLLVEHEIHVTVLAILSRRTAREIGDFFDLALKLGVQKMSFTRLVSEGQGKDLVESGTDEVLKGTELAVALECILLHSRRTGVKTSTNQPLFALIDHGLGMNGQYGFQSVIVDYQGNLKVSSRTPTVLGNVLKEGLDALFLGHPIMQNLRERKVNGCGTCSLYGRCGGDRNASFAAYGSYFEKDPGCWI